MLLKLHYQSLAVYYCLTCHLYPKLQKQGLKSKQAVTGDVHMDVREVVAGLARITVQEAVAELVMEPVKAAVGVYARMGVQVAVLAMPINHENKRAKRCVAGRHRQEHHVYCDQGLPAGLQILLPRGEK